MNEDDGDDDDGDDDGDDDDDDDNEIDYDDDDDKEIGYYDDGEDKGQEEENFCEYGDFGHINNVIKAITDRDSTSDSLSDGGIKSTSSRLGFDHALFETGEPEASVMDVNLRTVLCFAITTQVHSTVTAPTVIVKVVAVIALAVNERILASIYACWRQTNY